MEQRPAYLRQMLQTPVDPSLQCPRTTPGSDPTLSRPPGVQSLAEWGQQVIPSGKHAGKNFETMYEKDKMYVNQMVNRNGVSPWVKSFQQYCKTRRAASHERCLQEYQERQAQQAREQQMPVVPKSMAYPKSRVSSSKDEKDHGWEPVDFPVNHGVKRSSPKKEPEPMDCHKDTDKIAQLQTQIAILSRELAKEQAGSASESTSQ